MEPIVEAVAAQSFRSFKDPALAHAFERDGYVLIQLLDKQAIDEVNTIYKSLGSTFGTGWHTDMFSDDVDYRRATHEKVGQIFENRLGPMLDGYRYSCGNFVVKEPRQDSVVPLHQDWTIIDPKRARSINVICPLVDTNKENGQLCVVPGSHAPPSRISFGPHDKLQIEPLLETINDRYLRRLRQRAGEALVYDGRLLHSSGPNTTDSARICFSAGFIPSQARLFHYFKDDATPDKLDVYEVNDEFFWSHKLGERPRDAKFIGTIDHVDLPITQAHLDAWAAACSED